MKAFEQIAHKNFLQIGCGNLIQVSVSMCKAMNAVKEKSNPQIILSASETGKNKIAIKVSDNGVGIPSQNLDKIFIPFFSTTNSSGIGLSLCKQIMMVHNGNILVQSVEGKGSVILLMF